ncbi:guanine nucleotide exchange factor [Flagelloscypha sp. PMI_526]|nr:guanine nucleotide exchange factor [Flagelloscypha sp. PMI_526]
MDLSTTERTSRINALFVELDGGASTPSESLLALKELAKHPAGSTVLAVPHNLRRLLDYATRKYKDDLNAQVEALRCIANCLLLVEEARITFVDAGDVVVVGEEVDGPQICLSELEKSSRHPVTFVLARILFLSTVAQTQAVIDVVEKFDAIRIVALKLDELTNAFITGEPMVKEAMTDILKFTFNLLMHYPKVRAVSRLILSYGQ